MTESVAEATRRKGSWRASFSAVLWSFFGVRKGKDHNSDMEQLNPLHVVVVGLFAGALFVLTLILIVQWVVATL